MSFEPAAAPRYCRSALRYSKISRPSRSRIFNADRAPRPFCIDCGADRGGGIGGLDFGFGDKRRAAIVGGGKELKPEPLRPRRENAIHLFQRINLGERPGRSAAPGLRRARPAEGRRRPAKRRLSSTISHRKIARDAAVDVQRGAGSPNCPTTQFGRAWAMSTDSV